MKSEKVKEIKEALEERTQHKPINCSHSECVEACGRYCRHHREFVADMGSKNGQTCENCNEFNAIDEVKEYADILNLINELESENERLMKLQARGGCKVVELGIENQQLKDRIAELENTDYYKEIEKKKEELLCKEYSLIKYEKEIAGKYLKEFAEKVKEKALLHCKTINCYELKFIEETIDELLEEHDK